MSGTRHFTATAFVLNTEHTQALLLWHKRLERWMPPGGHIEPNEIPEEAALRECKEETGLDVQILGEPQNDVFAKNQSEGRMLKKPFALLLEEIPASKERNEPAHQHMDFVYIAEILDTEQIAVLEKEEGRELRWFTKDEIAALDTSKEIFANVQEYILRVLR